jgi:hypothetical protein
METKNTTFVEFGSGMLSVDDTIMRCDDFTKYTNEHEEKQLERDAYIDQTLADLDNVDTTICEIVGGLAGQVVEGFKIVTTSITELKSENKKLKEQISEIERVMHIRTIILLIIVVVMAIALGFFVGQSNEHNDRLDQLENSIITEERYHEEIDTTFLQT